LTPPQLQGSALTTIITLILLRGWSLFRGPIPQVCWPVSALLTGTWAGGFGTLVEALRDNITVPCTTVYWGNDQGIMVCTLYKTLFVGAGVGLYVSPPPPS